MSKKFEKWDEFESKLNITPEQEIAIELEMNIIKETIEARKKLNITQNELSKKTGIKQPAIARFENGTHSPTINTLIKMLVPMGYGIKVVDLNDKKKKQR